PSIVGSTSVAEPRRTEATPARNNYVSPFAADSARKGTPRQESSVEQIPPTGPRMVAAASTPEPVIMGSAALARDSEPELDRAQKEVAGDIVPDASKPPMPEVRPEAALSIPSTEPAVPSAAVEPPVDLQINSQIAKVQAAVLQALTDGNQRIL